MTPEAIFALYGIGFLIFLRRGYEVTRCPRKALWCGIIWPVIVVRGILES